MKEIQTKAGKILISQFGKNPVNTPAPEVDITKTYKILGRLSEFTDEECEEFVEYYPQPIAVYRNYVGRLDQAWDCGNSAKKSFISLLQSQGVDTSKDYLIIKIL